MRQFKSLIFFLLLTALLAEAGARLVFPIDPGRPESPWSREHPYIRLDWVPGFETTYLIDGVAGQTGTMEFKINPFGFRSQSMKTAEKPAGTQRIFFLGESTTESLYLPEEKTFPALVEKKLEAAFPDQKFESVNAAMSGYVAADSLNQLVYKVLYYQPDAVLVMHAINDLRYGTVPTFDPVKRGDYRRSAVFNRFDEKEGWKSEIRDFLKKSRLLTLVKRRLIDRFRPSPVQEKYDADRRKRMSLPFTSLETSRSLDDFIKYLEEIIWIAKGHGVRIILMTEPFIYQPNLSAEVEEKLWMGLVENRGINLSSEFLYREMGRFNEVVRILSQKHGVELIDLEKSVPKDLDHFYDDVHLTVKGSEAAAKAISDYFISRGPSSSGLRAD